MDWFLYDNSLRHERVKQYSSFIKSNPIIEESFMHELKSNPIIEESSMHELKSNPIIEESSLRELKTMHLHYALDDKINPTAIFSSEILVQH